MRRIQPPLTTETLAALLILSAWQSPDLQAQVPLTNVAAGDAHACALKADGGVVCWGNNDFGQLGDGTNEDRFLPVPALQVSPPLAVFINGFE